MKASEITSTYYVCLGTWSFTNRHQGKNRPVKGLNIFPVRQQKVLSSRNRFTVMIRFSARGAYLLWVPQGRALIRKRALIRYRALIVRLKELYTHMDIMAEKLRRRPLFL